MTQIEGNGSARARASKRHPGTGIHVKLAKGSRQLINRSGTFDIPIPAENLTMRNQWRDEPLNYNKDFILVRHFFSEGGDNGLARYSDFFVAVYRFYNVSLANEIQGFFFIERSLCF